MVLYICTKFHENILDDIKVPEQRRFPLEKFQRGIISQKIVDGVTVLFLCKLSDTSLFFYPVS